MADVICLRLRATDPVRWTTVALAWRAWAGLAGQWVTELTAAAAALARAWAGAAATAAVRRLTDLRRSVTVFRVLCWQADQALSEFAAALARARALLDRSSTIDDAARVAADADATAAARLTALGDVGTPPPAPERLPPCTATPAEVEHWWDALTPDQRRWLVATQAGWLGPLDGIPAAYRDLANRLLLDERRAELDRAPAGAGPGERRRIAGLRAGLDALSDRLAAGDGPRAYLLRLDLAGEGRAVVALGDPDRAATVMTQVPGMTAGLASYHHELTRAERVAVRAGRGRSGVGRQHDALAGLRRAGLSRRGGRRRPGRGRGADAAPVPGRVTGHAPRGAGAARRCSGTATARWWWARRPGHPGWPPTTWSSSDRPGSAWTRRPS